MTIADGQGFIGCTARLACAVLLYTMANGPTWAAVPVTRQLFDGHLHLIADDTQRYPRVVPAGRPGIPAGAPSQAAGGLPPGTGGQPGGIAGDKVVKIATDAALMLPLMNKAGVEAAAAVQKRGTYGFDNRYTLDAADQFESRFISVAVLDAEDVTTPARIRDLVTSRGLGGVRLTGGVSSKGDFPWLSSAQASKTWEAMNASGLVADLMVSDIRRPIAGLIEIARLADKYPNVRIVLDHAGYPPRMGPPNFGIDEAHAALAAHRNIYLKFTTINLDLLREAGLSGAEAGFVRRLVDVFGADHVLWGSDAGNSAGTYAEIIARIVKSTASLTASERQAVLYTTGRMVYVHGGAPARVAAAVPTVPGVPMQVAPFKAPSTALALEAAQAALEQCRANGYLEVSAAVVGADGELRVLLASDAAPPGHAVPNSERKAATAIAMQMATVKVLERTRSDASLAAQIEANPRWLARAGGELLYSHGEAIGAIGVSGAPGGDKDDVCATAAVARIADRL